MKGLTKVLGRGLLVLALGCCAVACGDDDDHPSKPDAGEAGNGGSAGKAGGGAGKAGGGAGKAGGSAGDGSTADCADTAKTNSGNMASDKCTSCLCGMKEKETSACTTDCWKLAYCVAANCDAADTMCIVAACQDDLGDVTKLTAAGTLARATPFTACSADCFGTKPPVDAETDGGN